ncbi:MAG TPA: hydantoinase/oxoprolinase family protein [Candidatus Xenobia bacterium]|nr:hydantoinase/oxoprolinase family protein [Candidatus Xenobia bacterium]
MRIAIDTGGTFTDCAFLRDGRLEILKVLSTPANPARAMAQGVAGARERLGERQARVELLHGTTVGTNALLERRGGRVALVTTHGFEDVLVIGRQARPELYNFFVQKPPPLVDAARRLGVRERIAADGRVLISLTPAALGRLRRAVQRARPQAVAVCLLFSYLNPAHERRLARALRALGLPVSVSHEILPEFREYERTSTVVVNAYLVPVLGRYLAEVEKVAGRSGKVGVMQSSGGTVSARVASAQPVRTLLSGPAGGVVGAQAVAARAGFSRIISFDMGGTSTDVALISGALAITNEASVGGVPVAVPMLDIHTVGAGGGSLAWFDDGGALRVGPQSAGADPGPICYGRGRQPTVTDAHLLLGRLDPDQFLGGEFRLDAARTRRYAQEFLRRAPGLRSVEELAAGIVGVANATMERAIRVISIERGHDPRAFTLVAFGGAGGLHACDLAAALGIPRVVVPKFPGALSALGILCSDVVKDYSRTVLWPVDTAAALSPKLESVFHQLERAARADLTHEGFSRAAQRLLRQLDLRYRGQAFELTVPYGRDFLRAFHQAHAQRYGYSDPARPIEVVTLRLRALGLTTKPVFRAQRLADAQPPPIARFKRERAFFEGEWRATDFYIRERLRPGNRIVGPAVIAEYSGTTVLPTAWRARVDPYENLLLEGA